MPTTVVRLRSVSSAANGRARFVWTCPICPESESKPQTLRMALGSAYAHESGDKHRMNEVHESRAGRRG